MRTAVFFAITLFVCGGMLLIAGLSSDCVMSERAVSCKASLGSLVVLHLATGVAAYTIVIYDYMTRTTTIDVNV